MFTPDDIFWPELPPGPLLVAVSGGADSVALLNILQQHPRSGERRFIVAHVHHGLRPEAADRDAAHVETMATTLGMTTVIGHVDVINEAGKTGESLEMAARRLRHAFLQKTATDHGCVAICTGHTADDQIETLFLRLARGTSLRGAGGMHPYSTHQNSVPIVRPLINLRHDALCTWLTAENIAWCEDATNTDTTFLRNRVRNHIIPIFEDEMGPKTVASTLRSMAFLREDNDLLETLAGNRTPMCKNSDGTLNLEHLMIEPSPIRRRILSRHLYETGLDPAHVNFATLARIDDLCKGPESGTLHASLGGGWSARRCNGALSFISPENATDAASNTPIATVISFADSDAVWGPIQVSAQGRKYQLTLSRGGSICKPLRSTPFNVPLTCSLSPAIAKEQIVIRSPRPGDRISPAGSSITQKLSDVLMNLKIPRHLRSDILLLAHRDGHVIWLPGYAVDTRAAVHPNECPIQIRLAYA